MAGASGVHAGIAEKAGGYEEENAEKIAALTRTRQLNIVFFNLSAICNYRNTCF
jgi:hypothetical protein